VHRSGKELTEREIQDLLARESPVLDEELYRLTLVDAYRFSDGRILFLFEGEPATGTLWESRESVLRSLEFPEEDPQGHILLGRFPHGPGFSAQIPELTDRLAQLVDLPAEELDYSPESLEILDESIKARFKPEEQLGAAVFPCLVAYLGEVVRQMVDGSWEVRHASHADVWEPWVRSPHGREFAPFACLYDQLIHHTDDAARLPLAVPAWARNPES
jgi:hypothetical protein